MAKLFMIGSEFLQLLEYSEHILPVPSRLPIANRIALPKEIKMGG